MCQADYYEVPDLPRKLLCEAMDPPSPEMLPSCLSNTSIGAGSKFHRVLHICA